MGHGMAKCVAEKGRALTVMGHRNHALVDDLAKRGAKQARSAAGTMRHRLDLGRGAGARA
jgi:3-hydroxyisobutyrate dehydrogenase-like beta-hydroxyacid dehydrogenase